VIESLPFNNVHVFSFSAREGTGAWKMADQVPGDVIKHRSRILHDIAARKKREFYEAQKGRTLRVLFEERHSTGMFVGFSDNYVKVAVESTDDIANRIGEVEITHVADSGRAGLLACGQVVRYG